jgi:hypothetical protein
MGRPNTPNAISANLSAAAGTQNAGAFEIVDGSGITRVVLGALGGGDYGLRVTAADGSTVIIDGTSDMFRIVATGTDTITGCNGGGVACTATKVLDINTGLTYSPSHLDFLGAVAGRAETLPRTVINNTAGGGTVLDHIRVFMEWIAGDHTQITLSWETGVNRSANTYSWRYYILTQASV